jgi:hypothetical protein
MKNSTTSPLPYLTSNNNNNNASAELVIMNKTVGLMIFFSFGATALILA